MTTESKLAELDYKEETAIIVNKFGSREAMDILGIEPSEAEAWLKKMSMMNGSTKANIHNRPFKAGLAQQYTLDILHGRWRYNGESIILSKSGALISGQHRCFAVIKAEKLRQMAPAKYPAWKGPVHIKQLIATGINDEVADTTDQGEKRQHGDVIFRKGLFDEYMTGQNEPEFKQADKKKLAKDLSTALRVVWLRIGGASVTDFVRFPKSEMLAFLEKHPRIKDCVIHVYRADDLGSKLVCSTVSRAYMAAAMYLAMTAASDRSDYDVNGTASIDYSFKNQAEDFVDYYASGQGVEAGNPVLPLKAAFNKQISSQEARDRDVILNMLVKAFRIYLDEEKCEQKVLTYNANKESLPRMGGLDVDPESIVEKVAMPKERVPKTTAKKKKPAKKAKAPVKKKVTSPDIDEDDDDFGDD